MSVIGIDRRFGKRLGRWYRLVFVFAVLGGLAFLTNAVGAQQDPECTIVGTEGPDVLDGGSGTDVICGLGGDDLISGGSGSDIIYGGDGNDTIDAGSGADTVYAEDGDDVVDGGSGSDIIDGGAGNDSIEAGPGADTVDAGDGNDLVDGGGGADVITGGPGDDDLSGGTGSDDITGDFGADQLFGGTGQDDLIGGPGVDSADGGSGSDTCAAETVVNCETVNADEGGVAPATVTVDTPAADQTVFADTQVGVTVEPADATGSVDVSVDGMLVGSSEIVDGGATVPWDTTTSADGQAVLLTEARDETGTVTATSSVTVTVDNSLFDMERIFADFDSGLITADEFAILATESIYVPNRLDERYGVTIDDGEDAEGTVAVLTIQALLDELSVDTVEILAAYEEVAAALRIDELRADTDLDPRDLLNGTAQQSNSPVLIQRSESALVAASNPVSGRSARRLLLSLHSAYWDNCDSDGKCEFTTENFRIGFVLESVNDVDGVPDDETQDDSDGFDPDTGELTGVANAVPDRIDHLAFELERGLVIYTEGMGYDEPPGLSFGPFATRIDVQVLDVRPQAPRGISPWAYKINVKPDSPRRTVRHELFHHVQFGYYFEEWFLSGTPWWVESSAQWASHAAGEALGDNIYGDGTFDAGPAGAYARLLDNFLGTPGKRLTSGEEVFGFANPRVYGAFILSEYLEDGFGPDHIRGVWELIESSFGQGAAWALWNHDYEGVDFRDLLPDFWTSAYLLRLQPEDDFDYDDLHIDFWRGELGPFNTGGDAQSSENRPRRTHIILDDQFSIQTQVLIGSGGAVFLDLTADAMEDGGSLEIMLSEEGATEDVRTRVIGFGEYPGFCMSAVDLPVGDNTVSVPIPAGCSFLTFQTVNTEDSSSRTAVRSFRFSSQTIGDPVNFDFETGDLTGWTLIDSGEGDNWWEIQSPGLLGTNYAFRIENTGAPIDGIEQTALRGFGDCGVGVTTTGEFGTTARLEVVDASDGTLWGSHEYTYTGLETEPVDLFVDNVSELFLPDAYTVRLLYVQRSVELAIVVFDEVEVDSCT